MSPDAADRRLVTGTDTRRPAAPTRQIRSDDAMPSHRRHDVIVVGSRAAGAATALLLGRLGHDVVLIDRAVFPADTVSTHQIARPGVVLLHRWGLLDAVLATGAPAIRRVTFAGAGETVTRTVKHKAGVDLLVAPRRHVLDALLTDAAAQAGVDVRPGLTVTGVRRDGTGRAVGVHAQDRTGTTVDLASRFVVGADGLRSTVARSVGAGVIEDRGDQGAVQYAYFTGLPWNGIEFISARAPWPGSSRRTAKKRACGSEARPRTLTRRAAAPSPALTRSPHS
jgi:flavin-dependent dehydrogenase